VPPPEICLLASGPYLQGGIERLTWEVMGALRAAVPDGALATAALIGRDVLGRDPAFDYSGPPQLTVRSKLRFAAWVLRRTLGWRSSTALVCMLVNQAPVAEASRRLFGTRYAVWAHGTETWGSMERMPRLALRRAALVLCSSDYTREKVMALHGVDEDTTFTVHPPVSDAYLQRAARVGTSAGQAPPIVLSVGRVERGSEYKGFDTMIRALPSVAEAVPGVRYRIVGGGNGMADLRSLASDVGVLDRVVFLGRLPDEDLWSELEGARVFAFISRVERDGEERGEGFGIACAEAAAFARPVVGSTDGGAAEALVHGTTGLAIDPRDEAAVAHALLTFLSDPGAADDMGGAGRRWVLETLTPEIFGKQVVHHLREAGLLRGPSDG
jgi:glycosyltransferase involved in cell wall biosynthesis